MATVDRPQRRGAALAGVLLAGSAVALALGVYGKEHDPALKPLFLAGFSGMLQLKSWLATLALVLVLLQVATAVWMFGRPPGARSAPGWVSPVHRWSGSIAFTVLIPVVLHCLWSLGFATTSTRVLLHSVAGCAFYGAYTAKMLGLRVRGLPGWAVPVLGGAVFASFVLLWLTSALWFFTRSGLALT
ncbi:MAG: DUF6529 family protein [Jatrophihabitans sp.]|uniref:DUF6529 family protein n=1 Tax=Jatrophihabitans sp. TaxID=1932789 RepID=UPI0039128366